MTTLRTTLCFAAIVLTASPASSQTVDYLKEVKPILAASCYTCHGAIKQKLDLRLDTIAFMKAGGDGGPVIVPGKASESLLVKHILGAKGYRRMPPVDEGEPLKPAQLATIQRWLDQGARGPSAEQPEADPRDHWAFRPPVRPPVPAIRNPQSAIRNPIDAFIAHDREQRGLTPQGPAERGVLLRRVYLDLIGLPPTRAEMQAFLADDAPDAYEKVVDKLLARPQYGERWGRHWMDIWRYSDWWGLGAELRNSQRHIWHWRDWIVDSLNKDKGYDQMLREMLAADELYPTDTDALRGTGFLARHYFLFNRTTWLDETIEHTAKAFLGLTMNCCKCHDHKYDAFSQVDYYRFRAIFEPYQIRNDHVPGESDINKNGIPRVYDCLLDAPTYLHVRGNEAAPDTKRKLAPGLPSLLLPAGLQIQPIQLPVEAYHPGLNPIFVRDHLRAAEQQIAEAQEEVERIRLQMIQLAQEAPLFEKPGVLPKPTLLVRDDFTALSKERWDAVSGDWKLTKGKLAQEKVGSTRSILRLKQAPPTDFEARLKFVTLGGETYRSVGLAFDVGPEHDALVYLTPHAPARVQVAYQQDGKHVYPPEGGQQHKVALNQPQEIVLRVRGTLLNVSVNGQPPLAYRLPIARRAGHLDLVTFDASARFEEFVLNTLPTEMPLADVGGKVAGKPSAAQLNAALKTVDAKIAHAEASSAAVQARSAADRALAEGRPAEATQKLRRAAAAAEKQQALALAEWNLARVEAGDTTLKLTVAQAKAASEAARKALANPGETYTRILGSVKTRGSNVESEAERTKPFPRESTGRRAALAKWVADRQNPLAARVAVNHIWTRHFGQPLVASVFDFGRKGVAPTHPELLDWLAVELMEHRWSMKHLHRLLVTSNLYRTSSSALGSAEKNLQTDADNARYWRMNTLRMEAQVVRDALLHLADELDTKLGGFPVEEAAQNTSRRRSMYFFHSAISRNRLLTTFDDADPLDCYRRRESIIPQQALALSNSKLAGSMAEKIASQLDKQVAPEQFAREAFTWLLGYAPTAEESAACEQALAQWRELNKMRPDAAPRARRLLVLALLNHNDFITIR